jgi:hypothetical protein
MNKFLLSMVALGLPLTAEVRLGAAPAVEGAMDAAEAFAQRDKLAGTQVRVRGRITEVCRMAGCWVALASADAASGSPKTLRVKVTDGEIVFPKDSPGKVVVVAGKLERFKLNRAQVIAREKHEAEEQGRAPRKTIPKSEWTVYQIAGTGAVILD